MLTKPMALYCILPVSETRSLAPKCTAVHEAALTCIRARVAGPHPWGHARSDDVSGIGKGQ